MTQQPFTPLHAADSARPAPPSQPCGFRDSADRVLHLHPGQGHLVWLEAGSELRSLSGTAVLNSAAHLPGASTLARLPPHTAWRSAHSAWVGVQSAEGALPATLLLTLPEGSPRGHAIARRSAPREGHPWSNTWQRLRGGLRRFFARRAQAAG